MGLITGAASILSTAADVAGGVAKLGSNAVSLGAKFIKSWPGKLILGAGLVSAVTANPNKPGGTVFGKIGEGLKGLLNSAKEAIGNFMGKGAAQAAVAVTGAGITANQYSSELREMIETGATAKGELAGTEPAAPVAEAPAPEQAAVTDYQYGA